MSSPVGTCGGGGAVGSTLAAALQFFAASQCLLQEPYPAQGDVRNGSCFDFIIVGGGSAGAAVAARLAHTHATVLLLEAGPDPPQETIIPGFKDYMKGGPYDWQFRTDDDGFTSQALSGGSQRQPRGRMLGGSGSLSDMVYARGFPADYDEWAALAGDDGQQWRWDNVLEYFKRTERMTDEAIVDDPELMAYHGLNGEIEVSGTNETAFDTNKFLEGFEEIGFKIVRDMTSPKTIGAGRFSHTIAGGRRVSSLTALLNKAAKRSNLFVVKNALVTKVLIDNSTAYGVEVLEGADTLKFYARKEVIISAGTFNTAKLLLLSGIGPREHLETLGVDVVREAAVGANLQDHVMVLSYWAADNGTCFSDRPAAYMDMVQYLYDRTGRLAQNNGMGAYLALKGSSTPNVPDFAFYPSCMPVHAGFYDGCTSILGLESNICSKLAALNEDRELITVAVVLLKPSSRGSVRLRSTDPLDTPVISSGTFSDSTDLDGYPEAMDVVRRLMETSYFKQKQASLIDIDIEGCRLLTGVEAVKCQAKAMAMSAWHSCGTAAMGAVVDSRLRVQGVSSLRVADASVMPRVVRGNTNAPVIMIAEKAADFIKSDYGLS